MNGDRRTAHDLAAKEAERRYREERLLELRLKRVLGVPLPLVVTWLTAALATACVGLVALVVWQAFTAVWK